MTENTPIDHDSEDLEQDELEIDEQDTDELEKKLIDAMKDLGRKNRKVEEYLDGIARSAEKPVQETAAEENVPPQN